MENNYMAKSSFCYHKVFGGKTIMIIVPHEDDEINLAGATIYGAAKEGIRVLCVFVTDGDWEYPASVRRKKISALQGFGDS